ncbi:MAG: SDR family NAD(P)-dependent oxidoreductase [Gemmatimonadales bacterium]
MSEHAPLAQLSALQLALLAKQVRERSESVRRADPIAIVGLGCRFPGGADSADQYWTLLCERRDGVRDIPADRWDVEAWYSSDPAAVAKCATRRAGLLAHIDGFDAEYFGILPREAERMDPQQRLFLEVAIEAVDDAGLPRERLRGSRAGVFVASYHNDYAQLQYEDPESIDERTLTGTLHSVIANRLSYLLDLRGPSLSVDTACSSSLVAIHLACESLRSGESDIGIAGGVSLIVSPPLMVSMSKVGFMAPDGRCKTFDAAADGFGRGEGCGVVVLKRLSDAVAEGDRVVAVIRGSAVNQDGHSTVLAAPNGLAQRAMIREALSNAQVEPSRIGFVETHGTGTPLGDPIEIEAIAATVGQPFADAEPCFIGAAKANLGHLEAAAGVAGLIKAVLCLRHQAIPPQPNFEKLSPHISLGGTRLSVPTEVTPWPTRGHPRCASTSSFGVGGTNAHVILEEAPALPPSDDAVEGLARIVTLSAQSGEALRATAEQWVRFVPATPASFRDLAFTATQRRTHYDQRLAVVARTNEELRDRLTAYLRGESTPACAAGSGADMGEAGVAFVFSGQGPQWYAMGRELMATERVFRDEIDACAAMINAIAGWSLVDELGAPESASRLGETAIAQPAIFSVQVALAALWRSWGIAPAAVVGHSVGEVAALHVAGVLSLEDAIGVVVRRGRIMQDATGLGRMASVGITRGEAAELIHPYGDRLSVAAINAPRSIVLSGETAALQEALAALAERGVTHRLLPVNYAFHSAQMAPFQERLVRELRSIRPAQPRIAVYSTVTGGRADGDLFDAAYFGRNVREPVDLASAVAAMAHDGHRVFLELSPHPVLSSAIAETLADSRPAAHVVASLRRDRPERDSMLQACAALYAAGCSPRWDVIDAVPGEVVSLPSYPWQRKRYWIPGRPKVVTPSRARPGAHPLLGRRVAATGRTHVFQSGSDAAAAWLGDHRIFGHQLIPGAAMIEMLRSAAATALESPRAQLHDFTLHRPLRAPEDGVVEWQVVVNVADRRADAELYEAVPAIDDDITWRVVASAFADADTSGSPVVDPIAGPTQDVDLVTTYERFDELGIGFGPMFRCLRDVRKAGNAAEAWVELPSQLADARRGYSLHPVVLDAALQLCCMAGAGNETGAPSSVMLPLGADTALIHGTVESRFRARARARPSPNEATLTADVTLETEDGNLVAAISGMRFARALRSAFEAEEQADSDLYRIGWTNVPAPATAGREAAGGEWLVLCDRVGIGDALADQLAARGGTCVRVYAGDDFATEGPDHFGANPAVPDHLARVIAQRRWSRARPIRGVVHLWSLDIPPFGASAPASSERDDLLGVGSAVHLVQALASSDGGIPTSLSLVTRGAEATGAGESASSLCPRSSGLAGLLGVIAVEHPELHVRAFDLDPSPEARSVADLVDELLRPDIGRRAVAFRGGERMAPRLERVRPTRSDRRPDGPLRLELIHPGTLDGIRLEPMTREVLPAGTVRVRVRAAGLNFRDVLVTLGMYPGEAVPPLGVECAGVVTEVAADVRDLRPGMRVFGYAPRSLATEVIVPAAFLARVPDGLSDEQAASLPVAYATAYYGLHHLAGIERGERVLIHAAAGGVGLAAVQLALRAGAVVFATAGSPEKRAFLRSIGVQHVMDSRSLAFADEVRTLTNGAGVDVALNSLAGEFIPATLGVVARHGHFLEIGKRDVMTTASAAALRPDVKYDAYDLGATAETNLELLRPIYEFLLAALADGSCSPLPVTVFGRAEISDAFRFMAQARHIGKIVISMPNAVDESPLVSPSASYWITGGFGALGLATARWLAGLGARSLVLSGRNAPSEAARVAIDALERSGVEVRALTVDAADRHAMQDAFATTVQSSPPLRGVIHAAGVLHDAVLLRQTWAQGRDVLRAKAHGAWVLHDLTRDLPLDFFILYSAAGLHLGPAGQGLYPAANAELDALARARHAIGLPALSVGWGIWAGLGMGARTASRGHDPWASRGLGAITPEAGFAGLEALLREGTAHGLILPIDWGRFHAQLPSGLDRDFFAAVAPTPTTRGTAAAPREDGFVSRLLAEPPNRRVPLLREHLVGHALRVLGVDAATRVDPRVPLKDIGLDSLMAVELRNALARSFGRALPATLLFDYPTIDALGDYLGRELGLAAEPAQRARPARPVTPASSLDVTSLSDAEAEALLVAEIEARNPGSPQ